ncbi:glycosyltransferase [Micromonospora eburnea]|uniref:Glycosyltransferase involved in cell wall bisynthesis n=1 Tax=Micromonospora eburnea TaxID=227316 RepID=A0A1C6V1A7_9ACTN|nr:glycosyltransferase [Micromonospora eburnea]SCL60089.1 Glycosyltransferase involved in cell wall bisynthesis [Micromonospora eburnea]
MNEIPQDDGGVTVITLTRRRPDLVRRAIRSVREQRTAHPVRHLVLIDDCPATRDALDAAQPAGTEVLYMPREYWEVSGPGRSSKLRNFGVRRATDRWIAFLDDDNEWTPDHLDTLITCAVETGARAVHSHVQLLNRDGTPYLEPRWPWAQNPDDAAEIYRDYVAKGIVTPGSNIVGDRPGFHDEPADTSSWLLDRRLLLEVTFAEEFSSSDAENLIGEDDKLFWALIDRGESIECSRRPTLRYYLGGYSNSPTGKTDETFSWATGQATAAAEAEEAGVSPEDDALAKMLGIAERIFGQPVEPTANFFDLGGTSLAAIRLITLLEAEGWSVTVEDVFDLPDMLALARSAARKA